MSEPHRYEARVWQGDDGWHAKVLRNEVYYDTRNGFETHAAALEWAQAQADADRLAVAQERKAERVTL